MTVGPDGWSERTEDGILINPKLNEHVRGQSAPPIYR